MGDSFSCAIGTVRWEGQTPGSADTITLHRRPPSEGRCAEERPRGRLATASLPAVPGEHPGSQGTLGRRT